MFNGLGKQTALTIACEDHTRQASVHEDRVPSNSASAAADGVFSGSQPPPCTQRSLSERRSAHSVADTTSGEGPDGGNADIVDVNANDVPAVQDESDGVVYSHSAFWAFVDDMLAELREDCRSRAQGDLAKYQQNLDEYVSASQSSYFC